MYELIMSNFLNGVHSDEEQLIRLFSMSCLIINNV